MKIAVICAFDDEIKLLRAHIENAADEQPAGIPVTRGIMAGHDVVLSLSGIGKVNAGATAQYLILAERPDVIFNIGLAGNCSEKLSLGGAVVADRLVYHDINMAWIAEGPPGITEFTPDAALRKVAEGVCASLGVPFVNGTVATGDQFIKDTAVRADIVERTGAACVEMEGAAIAHIAHKNNVRYATVKVMSDAAGDEAHDEFVGTLSIGGYCETSAQIIRGIVAAL